MIVEVFHNISPNPMRFLNGYEDGDLLVHVCDYTSTETDVQRALEQTFMALNIGDEAGDMQAITYRQRKNRSLSVGDVCVVNGQAYKCVTIGWKPTQIANTQVRGFATHGTTPLAQVMSS